MITITIMARGAWCEVDVNRAGEGELEIMVNKGTVANSVRIVSTGVFQVSFVPKEPKPHTVDIKFNSAPLPGTALKNFRPFICSFAKKYIWECYYYFFNFYFKIFCVILHNSSVGQ